MHQRCGAIMYIQHTSHVTISSVLLIDIYVKFKFIWLYIPIYTISLWRRFSHSIWIDCIRFKLNIELFGAVNEWSMREWCNLIRSIVRLIDRSTEFGIYSREIRLRMRCRRLLWLGMALFITLWLSTFLKYFAMTSDKLVNNFGAFLARISTQPILLSN